MNLGRRRTVARVALAVLLAFGASDCWRSRRSAEVPVLPATYVRQLLGPAASEADALAFSADGTILAVTYQWPYDSNRAAHGWVSFFHVPDGAELRPTLAVRGVTQAIGFSPDGRYAIVGLAGEDSRSLLFSLEGATVRDPVALARSGDQRMAFSPDGTTVALTRRLSMAPELLLFPLPDGACVRDFSHLLQDLQPTAYETPSGREAAGVAISPDGALLAFSRSDGARGIARVSDGTLLFSLGGRDFGQSETLAFSPDGARLASTNSRTLLQVWTTRDGRSRFTLPMPSQSGDSGTDLAFDPRADRVFVIGPDGTVLALSGSTGAVLGALGAVPSPSPVPPGAKAEHAHGASRLAVSRDGRWLAFTDGSRGARLFRLR